MRHRWNIGEHTAKTSDGKLARARFCYRCGKTQVYDYAGYDRAKRKASYSWQPRIGRCVIPAVAGLAATLTRDVRATPTPSTTAQADNDRTERPQE